MIISDKIYIPVDTLGRKVTSLCTLFTYPNPDYFMKKRLKLSTRGVDNTLYNYKIISDDGSNILILPRGGLNKVKDFFDSNGFTFRILDERLVLPEIDCHLKNTVLEDQQNKIIDALIKNDGGLIQMDPGGGKSIAIIGLIARLKQPTLILVHEHRLRRQWEIEIEKRLGGNFKLGRYDGDKKIDGDICTSVINTVYNMMTENHNILDNFGLIITDESHHVPAHMFLNVVNNSMAKYRVGITATIERRDGNHIITYDVIGDALLKIGANELKHRITTFNYEMINTDILRLIPTRSRWTGKGVEDVMDIVSFTSELIANEKRNNIIFNKIIESIKEGYYPIIISSRVNHIKHFYNKLIDAGYKTVLLIGATRKKTNWEEIRDDTSIQAICATDKIISEGLDLPRSSAIHLTIPTSNLNMINQRIGRIRRYVEGKITPKVYDYVDNLHYLSENDSRKYIFRYTGRRRMRYYEKLINEYDSDN